MSSIRPTDAMSRAAAFVAALVLANWPGWAVAQQPGASKAAGETSIHGGWLVIAAYIALWVGIMGYVGWLAYRQSQLDSELDELEDRLDQELEQIAEPRE